MLKAATLLKPFWKPLVTSVRRHPYPASFHHFLQNQPCTETTKLCNGLTVASETRETCNVCVGIFLDAGSRYESNFENGISHFFEHIAFKATRARTREVLESQMNCTGARFKCFTNREMTVYYAECLLQDVPVVVDILSDCVYNNCYSPTDIESQKEVVYQEMLQHDQNAEALLNDYLHATAFQGSPLAQTVMGPTCNLYNFTEETIRDYVCKHFDPNRTVLAASGGVTHEQLVTLACSYMSKFEVNRAYDYDVYRYSGSDTRFRDDGLPAANIAVALEAPCFCDDDRVYMDVAASMVGGWDRSQFAGTVHSNYIGRAAESGYFCDAYKAFNLTYKDTGLWGVQFLAPPLKQEDMIFIVQDIWMKMCTITTPGILERARRETKTKLLSRLEGCTNSCLDMGRWVLYNEYRPTISERICAIDRITVDDFKDVCMKFIYDQDPVVAAVGPCEGLPEYTRIKGNMYWLRF